MGKTGTTLLIFMAAHLVLAVAVSGSAPQPADQARPPEVDAPAPSPEDLPVEELLAPDSGNDVLALILSGDGGWADLDRDFGNAFQQRGIATVGFDCLKYFWQPRHPSEVSGAVETTLRYYLKIWKKKQVMLVGYSFGASWLPLVINRLPADLRNQISLVVLLAPGLYTNIEIKVGDWFRDIRRPGALDITKEAAALRQPLLCVYGTDEKDDSLCPRIEGGNRRILAMPGGHHFNHDYPAIEDAILKLLKSTTYLPPSAVRPDAAGSGHPAAGGKK